MRTRSTWAAWSMAAIVVVGYGADRVVNAIAAYAALTGGDA